LMRMRAAKSRREANSGEKGEQGTREMGLTLT
jgi:hypothetical protein